MRKTLALLIAVAALALMVTPVGALQGPESVAWLEVPHPTLGYCGYAHATIDASNPLPASAKVFASAQTIVRTNNPCTPGITTSKNLPAGSLKVQGSLRCRWGGGAETEAWRSSVVSNAANTGQVTVSKGGTVNPCQDPDHLGLEERTVVHSWFVGSPDGNVDFLTTTHWVTP